KRLEKLFDNINQVEPTSEPKPRPESRRAEQLAAAPSTKNLSKRAPRVDAEAKGSAITQTDTALSLPFKMGQNQWASLQVLDETAHRKWSDDDQLLIKQVTDQLSLAIENVQLFQETQRRAQEMTVLAEVGREISATLTLEAVLERITSYAFDLLN